MSFAFQLRFKDKCLFFILQMFFQKKIKKTFLSLKRCCSSLKKHCSSPIIPCWSKSNKRSLFNYCIILQEYRMIYEAKIMIFSSFFCINHPLSILLAICLASRKRCVAIKSHFAALVPSGFRREKRGIEPEFLS
jgi:hypothetical protein